MLQVFAEKYIQLGEKIGDARVIMWITEQTKDSPGRELDDNEKDELKGHLDQMRRHCKELGLAISNAIIVKAIKNLPRTERELSAIINVVYEELKDRLFFFIPSERATHFNNLEVISDRTKENFPSIFRELRQAGNCIVGDLPTASVFHAMRALEIGLRALALQLEVSFPHPIELEQWHNIIEAIESKITNIVRQPKGKLKNDDLRFYSGAAIQFRYFKDAWRNHVSHARETYSDNEALEVLRHTVEFFEAISVKIKEVNVS